MIAHQVLAWCSVLPLQLHTLTAPVAAHVHCNLQCTHGRLQLLPLVPSAQQHQDGVLTAAVSTQPLATPPV
jgi:hypothetical protein